MDNTSQPSSSDQPLPLSEAQLQAWQKELHTRYERHKGIAPTAWYSDDIIQNITIDKFFTPPKLLYKVHDITVDQLLTLQLLGKNNTPRVMTLLGPAGAGKTCICLKLLNSWSQDPKSFPGLENLDFIFFIQCRYVSTSLGQHLIKHLLPESCKDQSEEKLSQILKNYRILFLVDDYDGTKASHQLLVNEMLTTFPKSRLLLTTQLDNFVHFPGANFEGMCGIEDVMCGIEDVSYIKIDLHGFCITKVMEYVSKAFSNLYKSEEKWKLELQEFKVHIKTLPDNFQELLRHPLYLTMYTVLWYHDQAKTKRIETLTTLYYETVNISVQKLAEHHHKKDSTKPLESYISQCYQFVNKLGEGALILLQRNQIHLDDMIFAQLTQVCQALNLDDDLCFSSLLQKDILYGPDGKQVEHWCFSSKTFHEYFAAFFLQNCVCVHGTLPDSIYSLQFFNRYVRVFWFIVGLLSSIENQLSKEALKTVVATMLSQSEYNDLHCSFVSLVISESHENETVIEATGDFLEYISDEESYCISNRKLLTLLRCTELHVFPNDQFTPCFVEDHDYQLPYCLQEYGCPVHLFIAVKSKECLESLAKDGKVLMMSEGVHTTLHMTAAIDNMDADILKDLGYAWVTSFHDIPTESVNISYIEWSGDLQADETIVRIMCRMTTLEEYEEKPIIHFKAGKSLVTPMVEMLGHFLAGVQKAEVTKMDFVTQHGYYSPSSMQLLATLKQLPFPLPEKLKLHNMNCDATFTELLNHVAENNCFLQVDELRLYDSKSFALLQNNIQNISKHLQNITVVVSHWDEWESSQKSVTQFGNWWASNCLPNDSTKLELLWKLSARSNCHHYQNCFSEVTCEFGDNAAVRFKGSQNEGKVLSKFLIRFMEGLTGAGKKTVLSVSRAYQLGATILLDLLKGFFPSEEKQSPILQLPPHLQIAEAMFSPEFLEVATFSSSLGSPIVISQTLKVLRICDLILFADQIDVIANCFNQIMVSVEGWEEEQTPLEAVKKLGVWWAKRKCGTAQVRNLKIYHRAVMDWERFQATTIALDNDPGPILTWKSAFGHYKVLSKLVKNFLEGVRNSGVETNISYGDIMLAESSDYTQFTAFLEDLQLPAPLHIFIPVASCNPTFTHILQYTQQHGITLNVTYVQVNSYEKFLFLCDNIETFSKLQLTMCVDVCEWDIEVLNKKKVQEMMCWWGQKFSKDGIEIVYKAQPFENFSHSGVLCFFGGPLNISWNDSEHNPVRLGKIMGVVLESLIAAGFSTKMVFQVERENHDNSVYAFLNQIEDQILEKIQVDKTAFKPSS